MATPTNLPVAAVSGDVLTAAYVNALRGGFRILQVVTASKSDTFTSTSSTFTDVTGLSVSITPQATSSKILIIASVSGTGASGATSFFGQLVRNSTAIAVGDTAVSRSSVSIFARDAEMPQQMSVVFLDSPVTTSATTYKVQIKSESPGTTVVVNRSITDNDAGSKPRSFSSITVLEVSA